MAKATVVVSKSNVLVQLNSLALGGTQINALDLANAVKDYGFQSHMYGPEDTLPEEGPSLLDVAAARGLSVLPYQRPVGVLRKGSRELKLRAKAIDASIIHVYGADADPRSAFWGPCRLGGMPLVQTIYEMAVQANTYRHSSLIIGTGYLKEELATRPGPTELISPPVDLSLDAPNELLSRQFKDSLSLAASNLIVIVSRLDKAMKAYPVEAAIRAMPYLKEMDACLVVVGTGTEKERLVALGQRVNHISNKTLVHFTGALADPRGAYAAGDVVLGMGGSAARALAFGRPLIVQGERGTAELFDPGSSGGLFRRSFWNPNHQADAPEVLADAIKELLKSPQRRHELGAIGRKFAEGNFGLDAMAQKLASVYETATVKYGSVDWVRDLDREMPELAKSIGRRIPKRLRHRKAAQV